MGDGRWKWKQTLRLRLNFRPISISIPSPISTLILIRIQILDNGQTNEHFLVNSVGVAQSYLQRLIAHEKGCVCLSLSLTLSLLPILWCWLTHVALCSICVCVCECVYILISGMPCQTTICKSDWHLNDDIGRVRHRWRFRLTLAFGIAGKGAGRAEKLWARGNCWVHNVSIMTCQTSDKLHVSACLDLSARRGWQH